MRRVRIFFAALIAIPIAASAHITFAEPRAEAGSYYAGFLRVTHGCGGSPTVAIRVDIPAAIAIARPQPKAGWTLAIEHTPLAEPIRSESGSLVKERVSAVTWTGNLPADEFDQFGLMLKLPADAGALYFPTTQRCVVGINAWINRPGNPDAWHNTKDPAPMLLLIGRSPKGADMDHMPMAHP